jgi:hypothetical protein
MTNLTTDELIEELRERLRRAEKVGDWVDAAHDGELLTSSQSAEVAGITAETIRIYAERAEAAGRPIGVQFADVWIISRARLLDFIARRDGKPARLMAEKRAEKRAVSRLDGFYADLVRMRYIRLLRANLITHATAGLAALTLFDPGSATRRAEYRSLGLFRLAMWADDAQ